jgi:S-adenosylmethionine:tRNA ribosyltransferase-isomerase
MNYRTFLKTYSYRLPPELLAQEPATPRDNARLFIYYTKTDTIAFDIFRNLETYLPPKSFLVLNKTKVIPCRITLARPTGGRVRALLLFNESPHQDYVAILDRGVLMGETLSADALHRFTVVAQDENRFTLRLSFPRHELIPLLFKRGATPLPPYLKHTRLTESERRREYQNVFAQVLGSSAAPTASLHFTNPMLTKLKVHGIPQLNLTLHVGLGTFAPVGPENFKTKKLFPEFAELTPATARRINTLKAADARLIAVGTTPTRCLETTARSGTIQPWHGQTDIFITPGFRFHAIDGLITNFHVPQSSLMLLVDAFLKHKNSKRQLLDLYRIAIKERFRFYSFGDSMLIV